MRTYAIGSTTLVLAAFALACAPATRSQDLPLDKIKLPPGFRIEVYASNVSGARSMTLSPSGTLFVGTRGVGKVYAILDRDKDQKADEVITVAEGMDMPNGVAFRDGALYVAEVSRVVRYDDIEKHLEDPPEPVVVNDTFPTDRMHGWKFIAFGPDGMLYVPVGAPGNIVLREDERYASIMRMKPDGTGLEVFAHGVRNTVGLDWHPSTKELWFTDNGRDMLGDDKPPDELNRAPTKGLHFGYPFRHGKDVRDPEFGDKADDLKFTPPALELPAHVASLGMRFYTGRMFPKVYRNRIFIAEHGSWNRTDPIGYRVTMVELEGNRPVKYETFAEGWLQGREAWGRPVDVLVMPDGALLVSDDKAGAIYRISYKGERAEVAGEHKTWTAERSCPECGSHNILTVIWGLMPTGSPSGGEWRREGIIEGGCCIPSMPPPDLHCASCGHEWSSDVGLFCTPAFVAQIAERSRYRPVFVLWSGTSTDGSERLWRAFRRVVCKYRGPEYWEAFGTQEADIARALGEWAQTEEGAGGVILFYRGKAAWSASGPSVTEEGMVAALRQCQSQ